MGSMIRPSSMTACCWGWKGNDVGSGTASSRARMLEGRRAKAPARRTRQAGITRWGICAAHSGDVVLDPDEQAQGTIRPGVRAVRTLSRPLARCNCAIWSGARHPDAGANARRPWQRGVGMASRQPAFVAQSVWQSMIYAGIYAYGVRATDRRRQKPGRPSTGRRPPRAGLKPRYFCPIGSRPTSLPRKQFERNRGAASRQPGGPSGPGPGEQMLLLCRELAGLRPVRICAAHDGGLQQCRPCGALHACTGQNSELWRAVLSVAEGRTGRRTSNVADPASTGASGAGGQSGGCR